MGETLQRTLGPDLDQLGQTTGVIRRRRKFSGASLLKTIVLTLLRSPRAKADDFVSTAALLGVCVTPKAAEKRFTPRLVDFLRRALSRLIPEAIAAAPAAIPLLVKFTAVFVGDSTTVPAPDEYADEFPGCGGKAGAGKAAVKIQVLWDLTTGRLAQLLLEPGRRRDTNSPAVAEPPPSGSLTIRDLGYFDLSRFRDWAARGAYWLSRWQPGTVTCDGDGRPFDLLDRLRRRRGADPFDGAVLLGAVERLGCRLIALRAPQEVADRRRRKAYQKAQKHGGAPTAAHLAWCDWTVFVTNCPADLLTWKEVVVLYRARWQVELMFKLWKSNNLLTGPAVVKSPECRMATLWARLIGVLLQHWLLLTTTWPDARRSLWKAAQVIRDWVVSLAEALDDLDRLSDTLGRLRAAISAAAKINTRGKHPSSFQLLLNPELLDW